MANMEARMRRPPARLILAVILLVGACLPIPGGAQTKTLVVTGFGGRFAEVAKKALIDPFEAKYGVKVEVATGITTEWVAKLMAAGVDNPPFDVVMGDEGGFPIPRERGFFEPRNPVLAPNIRAVYDKALLGDTSIALFWSRIGLAYRTDAVKKKPQSWRDFWDAEYTGQRGTYTIGNTLGISFVFMSSRIFGSGPFDVDAGISAIKRAQPKLVDFTGAMLKLLEQKEVVIAVLHDAATHDLQRRGLPVEWVAPVEGVPVLEEVIQVTRGSKQKDLAWKYVDMFLSPEVQLAFATELFRSPTNRTVKVPPDIARKVLSGPADLEKLVVFDWGAVAKQRSAWTERWNKEMR
jgi:putative spermidine/putrescine transport system substrate-binding protein